MDLRDKRLWRKALAATHPDAGGDEEVFKFLAHVRDKLDEAYERAQEWERQQEAMARQRAQPPQPWAPVTNPATGGFHGGTWTIRMG